MDRYVTAKTIRRLREEKKMTQAELAYRLSVSDKTISKWETGRGYPDITLIEPLAEALGVSPVELLSGEEIKNLNRQANMQRSLFYVCPVCGNVIHTMGKALISCCGISLIPLEAEEMDENHVFSISRIEDEWYVESDHPMTRDHYISFMAGVNFDRCELVKLYPEGHAHARFKVGNARYLYAYCNKHGLYKVKLK